MGGLEIGSQAFGAQGLGADRADGGDEAAVEGALHGGGDALFGGDGEGVLHLRAAREEDDARALLGDGVERGAERAVSSGRAHL